MKTHISATGAVSAALPYGSTRQFGTVDIGAAGLISGWAAPEEGHTWNDGRETVFQCATEGLEGGCIVEFAGTPFFCEGVTVQEMCLHVNGFRVGYWRLTQPREHILTVHIEPEQIFRRDELSVLTCAWSFPDAVRPVDKGNSADSRELAFCFRSFAILAA